jgi:hypothetical protein
VGHPGHTRCAVLTIAAAIESARGPDAAGQIPLTRNEIAHLCERELAEVDQADRDQARVAGAVVAGVLDGVGGGGLA